MDLEPNKMNRTRLRATFIIVSLVFFGLMTRLAFIQVIHNDFYRDKAESIQKKVIPLEPKRGDIIDRNGVKLAFSVSTFTVWARMEKPKEGKVEEAAEALSKILDRPQEELEVELRKSNEKLVRLGKGLAKSKADLIKNKKISGVWVTDGSKRVYPYNNFAAQLLGFVSTDGEGLSGIEVQLNKDLAGTEGKLITHTDAVGRTLPFAEEKLVPPVEGYNVQLTIDEIIQHFTEKAVDKGLQDFQPKKIMAIVMDPNTGEILAMVTKPDFNPNSPRDLTSLVDPKVLETMKDEDKAALLNGIWRNPVVSDTYEPGSTLKLLTTAMALEEKVVSTKSTFKCVGYTIVSGVKIHCWNRSNPHGVQTLTEGLNNSCNPVFMEVAARVGKEKFHLYLDKFGLMGKTGISLPSEGLTMAPSIKKTGPVELATMGFGHGISTTPLHVATAVSAIANGGNLIQPQIVKAYLDANGKVIKTFEPKIVNRAISEGTAKTVRSMMEQVVSNGSGKLAYIAGIRIGGKTGTSEKIVKGQYSDSMAYSSFVGIAPIDNPKITVIVVVDEPKDITFGSKVAAPIAHDILTDTLRYLKIEPNMPQNNKKVTVPNLIGKTYGQARTILESSSLVLSDEMTEDEDPNALIKKQYPAAGTSVNSNSLVIITTLE